MRYRLYREDADGFSVLLTTFESAGFPLTYRDPVDRLSGIVGYRVVPVHPALLYGGEPLCGAPSQTVYVAAPISTDLSESSTKN